MIFLRDSLYLSAVTLSPQQHDILDFSNCPLSRVLHLTLANWQGFGFDSEVITIFVSIWLSVDQLNYSDFRLVTSKFKASVFGVYLISPEMESKLIQSESYKLLFLRIVVVYRNVCHSSCLNKFHAPEKFQPVSPMMEVITTYHGYTLFFFL